jgi:hypothetical protein
MFNTSLRQPKPCARVLGTAPDSPTRDSLGLSVSRNRRDRQARACGLMALLFAGLGLAACSSRPEIAYRPAFCYRSLADVDCYLEPDAGREGQLVGVHLWKEGDPATPQYWLARAEAAERKGKGPVAAKRWEIEAWRGAEVEDEEPCGTPCTIVSGTARMVGAVVSPAQSVAAAIW